MTVLMIAGFIIMVMFIAFAVIECHPKYDEDNPQDYSKKKYLDSLDLDIIEFYEGMLNVGAVLKYQKENSLSDKQKEELLALKNQMQKAAKQIFEQVKWSEYRVMKWYGYTQDRCEVGFLEMRNPTEIFFNKFAMKVQFNGDKGACDGIGETEATVRDWAPGEIGRLSLDYIPSYKYINEIIPIDSITYKAENEAFVRGYEEIPEELKITEQDVLRRGEEEREKSEKLYKILENQAKENAGEYNLEDYICVSDYIDEEADAEDIRMQMEVDLEAVFPEGIPDELEEQLEEAIEEVIDEAGLEDENWDRDAAIEFARTYLNGIGYYDVTFAQDQAEAWIYSLDEKPSEEEIMATCINLADLYGEKFYGEDRY